MAEADQKFVDEVIDRQFQFSLGTETSSGRLFLSTPVSGWNRAAEWEERFEIDAAEYARFKADPASAADFLEDCRNGRADERLFGR